MRKNTILWGVLGLGIALGYATAVTDLGGLLHARGEKQAEERSRLTAPAAEQPAAAKPATRPNIVFMLADNLGYGELGCYGGGILRGAPTPRIDQLARDGLRLLNFNVENQCTPSRSALMTGRLPIRSGTMRVPRGALRNGLTQWEITLAELLGPQGYATAHFGKWHLGDTEGRYPTDQGFDEWYGIPNSSDVSLWTASPQYDPKVAPPPHVLEGKKGEKTKERELYDLKMRRQIDTEITRRTIDFMKRQAKAGKPFYAYVPFTQVHFPTLPHPDFAGRTRYGDFADSLAEMDHHVGEIVDAVKELGIADNTLVIFTSDNGPEEQLPWRGWAGPWSGSYFTAMEGSLRAPFIARWPGKIPAGRVSNEIVHEVDTFTTLARLAGAAIPQDRIIDGVDQTDFFLGKQEKSNREGFPCYVGDTLYAVKWRNWKLHYVWQEHKFDSAQKLPYPRLFNLIEDPLERRNVASIETWVYRPAMKIVNDFQDSLKKEPPIPPGTPDPYQPARKGN
jgi:arylsulfatase